MKTQSLDIKLKTLKKELNNLFLERETLIDLYLSCMISGYSIFVGGMPGTGKTFLAKKITEAFQGKSCYRLLQASSTLEEIIGAVDLSALDKGCFRRKLENGAVMADTLILDEGFKANAVVLNALLGLILDKTYQNGDDGEITSPLNMTVVCSNELPQDESLQAFWDRFLVRFWVNELSPANRMTLMKRRAGSIKTPQITTEFTREELTELKEQSKQIQINDGLIEAIVQVTDWLKKEKGIIVSDRRHEQIVDLVKAYSTVLGKDEADDESLDILEHICWDVPEDSAKVKEALQKFGNPLTTSAKTYYQQAFELNNEVGDFDGNHQNLRPFQLGAQQRLTKISEIKDILQGKILVEKKNKKARIKSAEEYLKKIEGIEYSISEKIAKTYNLSSAN